MELVRPGPEHLDGYADALRRGWSADTLRGAEAAAEELERLRADPAALLAQMDDPLGAGPPVRLPDGSTRPRIPGRRWWMWDAHGFIGSIGLRWTAPGVPLPPHVLGHVGYSVVPWRRREGHATRALSLLLPQARAVGLRAIELTTDPDNTASQRVIEASGGRLVGTFDKGPAYGHRAGLRWRIDLR